MGSFSLLASLCSLTEAAQIFLNLITHGLWTIERVSLLIFDECHHARKNHPYNGILREYAQLPPSRRPKIFGMTASPIWNPRNPQASIQELEVNMHSKVVGIHENVAELEERSPKPEEVSWGTHQAAAPLTSRRSASSDIPIHLINMIVQFQPFLRVLPSSITPRGQISTSHSTHRWKHGTITHSTTSVHIVLPSSFSSRFDI